MGQNRRGFLVSNEFYFNMPLRNLKELWNNKIVESAFQKIAEHKVEEPHFVLAGGYHLYQLYAFLDNDRDFDQLKIPGTTKPLLELMKKYQIKSAMLTFILMKKEKLITKELMDSYCKGEQSPQKISVTDDLETLFEDLQLGKEPTYETMTYYLPKLTEDEMTLVETKDQNYFQNFFNGVSGPKNPDVSEYEMKMSESESKFILGKSHRITVKFKL